MASHVTINQWQDWLLEGNSGDPRLLHSDASDRVLICPDHLGRGYFQKILLRNDLSLLIYDYTLSQNLVINTPSQRSHLEFDFQVAYQQSGGSFFEPHIGLREISVKLKQKRYFKVKVIVRQPTLSAYLLAYIERLLPQARQVAERVMQSMYQHQNGWNAPASPEMPEEILRRTFANNIENSWVHSTIEQILPAPLHAETVVFKYANRQPITSEMQQALGRILSCPYQGSTRRRYLEHWATELVALRLAAMVRPRFTQDDLDRVERATAILRNQLTHPPTVEALARQVCTNRLKLNQSFRQVYGTTPFSYLRACRLNRAHYLLMTSDLPVSEVASAVGYTCRSKFATAFRQWRGINPKTYQTQMLKGAS